MKTRKPVGSVDDNQAEVFERVNKARQIDVFVTNHGSIWLFEPRTIAARIWFVDHLPEDRITFGGDSVAVEPRYAGEIIEGMKRDGLNVRGGGFR